jgi:heat shock protein 1/8
MSAPVPVELPTSPALVPDDRETSEPQSTRVPSPTVTAPPVSQASSTVSNSIAPAVGIDLGTTYSCVSVMQGGKVQVIANDMGDRTTRSIVSFADGERLVGSAAGSYLSSDPQSTIYGAKRLIGKTIEDQSIAEDIAQWPFRVTSEEVAGQNQTRIEVEYNGATHLFAPEQISAMVLEDLRKSASQYLGQNVTRAVITVPAYFNDSQRKATIMAGKLAGLDVLQILNEPTAAALAYGIEKLADSQKFVNLMVFDFGGGTLDVTLMRCMDGAFTVIATAGDTHLGGEDIDIRMLNYCLDTWRAQQPNGDSNIEITVGMRSQLRIACEQGKRTLSHALKATISVSNFHNSRALRVEITRPKFEDMAREFFNRCIGEIDRAFTDAHVKDAKFTRDSVQHVVLVGGSSRIPKIRTMLDEYFPRDTGSILCHQVNPDEVVSQGAAVQAAALTTHDDERLNNIVLVDVAPLSLGVETAGGVLSVLIPRNSTIPAKGKKIFSTTYDNQPSVSITAYEGLRAETINCRKLGYFELKGIQLLKKGVPRIEVIFELDTNGVLNISAVDTTTGRSKKMPINRTAGQLSDAQVQKMVDEAENFRVQDDLICRRVAAANKFEIYISDVQESWKDTEDIVETMREDGTSRITAADAWLSEWRRVSLPEDITAKQNELMNWFAPHFQNKSLKKTE